MGGVENLLVFAYFNITTAIGVSVFAMRLLKTHGFLHISRYKRNNAVSCRNTCSDSILFQYLCYIFINSMDIRFEISSKSVMFYKVFKLREFITKLIHVINILLNLNQFSIKN